MEHARIEPGISEISFHVPGAHFVASSDQAATWSASSHLLDQVDDAVRVAPLVVVPRDELDEVVVEGDARLRVDDRRVRVGDEVGRDDVLVGVPEDAGDALSGGRGRRN